MTVGVMRQCVYILGRRTYYSYVEEQMFDALGFPCWIGEEFDE